MCLTKQNNLGNYPIVVVGYPGRYCISAKHGVRCLALPGNNPNFETVRRHLLTFWPVEPKWGLSIHRMMPKTSYQRTMPNMMGSDIIAEISQYIFRSIVVDIAFKFSCVSVSGIHPC